MGLDRIELSSPACFGRRFTQGVAYRKPRTLRLTTPIKLEILYLAKHPREGCGGTAGLEPASPSRLYSSVIERLNLCETGLRKVLFSIELGAEGW